MSERPLILLTNDDGIDAAGIKALRQAMMAVADVVVVAPAYQRSACSHSITIKRPLHPVQHAEDVFAIDGTPADCVYIALHHHHFVERRPDVVMSGINHGVNLGTDVYYSGTVAGAREAAMRGIPGIAVSLDGRAEFEHAAALARTVASSLLEQPATPDHPVLMNINVPKGPVRGIRTTRLGRREYKEAVVREYDDAAGREYFVLGGYPHHDPVEGSDTQAVEAGFASITPLALEATYPDHFAMAQILAQSIEEPEADGT